MQLSRREELELAIVTVPQWLDWNLLQEAMRTDPRLLSIIAPSEEGLDGPKHYSYVHSTLFL